MYDIVAQVIGSNASPEVINFTCSGLILLLTVVFIDMIRDIIFAFMRG